MGPWSSAARGGRDEPRSKRERDSGKGRDSPADRRRQRRSRVRRWEPTFETRGEGVGGDEGSEFPSQGSGKRTRQGRERRRDRSAIGRHRDSPSLSTEPLAYLTKRNSPGATHHHITQPHLRAKRPPSPPVTHSPSTPSATSPPRLAAASPASPLSLHPPPRHPTNSHRLNPPRTHPLGSSRSIAVLSPIRPRLGPGWAYPAQPTTTYRTPSPRPRAPPHQVSPANDAVLTPNADHPNHHLAQR